MCWKVVFQITEGAKDSSVPSIFSDSNSDCLFSASRADKYCGEFLLDDPDYSSSSSPQWLELYRFEGQDSIFTFGSRTLDFAQGLELK